ncbi:DUF3885 domain-containing protein [Macrococcus armenti]|uniref:DUF3885 domain-containing protein n=1 Tax=Macrococcus armenti TaxID=2875764 RepID=UPI001CCEC710|nr:DUF3885 domain-containing protein [Macrococcus armenti]UBH12801.1 DUF3885 domain-containing protein [Macrococcus armenti]
MSRVKNINSLIDIDFNTLSNAYNVYLENELFPLNNEGTSINDLYFQSVYHNATMIFDEIFDTNDKFKLIHSISTNYITHRKSRFPERFLFKQMIYEYEQFIKKEDVLDIKNVFTYYCNKKDIKYKKLIKAICNQDFPGLHPNINQRDIYSSVFFININKDVLLHIYDDRGLIIAFDDEKRFEKFIEKYRHLKIERYTEDEI